MREIVRTEGKAGFFILLLLLPPAVPKLPHGHFAVSGISLQGVNHLTCTVMQS